MGCYNNPNDREHDFDRLIDSVKNCSLCPTMEARTGVLSELNGNIYSNVLFVAEAPGRLGADRTRIPLFGDQTGANFQKLIDTVGWSREDFFITNAVLCNPRNENGNNAPPCRQTVENCSIYLNILIQIMNPEYIITIGQKALDSVNQIEKVNVKLRDQVRTRILWNGRTLIPLYHMGPRALIHRNFYNQLADFYWLKNTVSIKASKWEKLQRIRLSNAILDSKFYPSRLQKVIIEILRSAEGISQFKLTKILYLADYEFLKTTGRLLTNSYYLRAYNGPLPMGMDKQLDELQKRKYILTFRGKYRIGSERVSTGLPDADKEMLMRVITKYAGKGDGEIKTLTYLTPPMRRILRTEKYQGQPMIWTPVFSADDFVLDGPIPD